MHHIAILVPTCFRPNGVRRTLLGLAKLNTKQYTISVIVGDNDKVKREGIAVAEELSPNLPWHVKTLVVNSRGIPHVRNALIKEAISDPSVTLLAFIDDDETPSSDWLINLLAVKESTGADIVGGSVAAEFEVPPPDWALQLELYETSHIPTGPIDLVDSTANVLCDAQIFRDMRTSWFDESFALTGGSDKELFLRLRKVGYKFAWSQDASVVELVPETRLTEAWILQRAYRVGNLDMRLAILSKSITQVAKELVISAVASISAKVQLIFSRSQRSRISALRRIHRQRGKISALRGHFYQEYATIHGA